ncbi:hypothetical protein BDV59DRAFT_189894 [Aspergillus ambiguus]|uniref:uncharacterized protein n=1 Tax=Aspergillus ambiguus TaxID=176160 RepID=UPI003CCCB9A1
MACPFVLEVVGALMVAVYRGVDNLAFCSDLGGLAKRQERRGDLHRLLCFLLLLSTLIYLLLFSVKTLGFKTSQHALFLGSS